MSLLAIVKVSYLQTLRANKTHPKVRFQQWKRKPSNLELGDYPGEEPDFIMCQWQAERNTKQRTLTARGFLFQSMIPYVSESSYHLFDWKSGSFQTSCKYVSGDRETTNARGTHVAVIVGKNISCPTGARLVQLEFVPSASFLIFSTKWPGLLLVGLKQGHILALRDVICKVSKLVSDTR